MDTHTSGNLKPLTTVSIYAKPSKSSIKAITENENIAETIPNCEFVRKYCCCRIYFSLSYISLTSGGSGDRDAFILSHDIRRSNMKSAVKTTKMIINNVCGNILYSDIHYKNDDKGTKFPIIVSEKVIILQFEKNRTNINIT